MNYKDIIDNIVEITDSLDALPLLFLESLMERHCDALRFMDASDLKNLRHPSITCITHLYMKLGLKRSHCIATIKVDNVPAFFFVASLPGTRYNNYYILNQESTKDFVRYLVTMLLEKALESADLPVTDELQSIAGIPNC